MSIRRGRFALALVYCIPTSWKQESLDQSADILSNESLYPASHLTFYGAFVNFTVALVINEAVEGGENPFWDSLESSFATRDDFNGIRVLHALSDGDDNELKTRHGERYWHGYLIVFKPLMVLMNTKQIRLLFQTICVALLCLLTIGLYQHMRGVGVAIALAFAVSVTLFAGWEATITLPVFFSFAVALAACLWAYVAKLDWWGLFVGFAVTAAITVYFDYLDNPFFIFSFPLLILVVRVTLPPWGDGLMSEDVRFS